MNTTAGWKFDKEDLDYIRAVYSVHPMVWDVLDEIERLQSQLATRDALIERLVEAGEDRDGILIHSHGYSSAMYVWRKLVDEWEAMKGGE